MANPASGVKTEVVICDECKGEGKNKYRSYSEFDNVEIEAGEPCNNCRGKGRLYKNTSIVYSYL